MPAIVKVQCSFPCLFSLVAGWKLLNSITGCQLVSLQGQLTLAKPWCVAAIEDWHWLQSHAYQRIPCQSLEYWLSARTEHASQFALSSNINTCVHWMCTGSQAFHTAAFHTAAKLPCMHNALVGEMCVWLQHGDHSSWVWHTMFRYACTLYTFHVIFLQVRVWSKSCNCHTKVAI